MKVRKEIEKLIEHLQAGTLSAADNAKLEQYLKQYPEYRDLAGVHQFLESSRVPFPEPAPEKFTVMRAQVMRQIRRQEDKKLSGSLRFFEQIYTFTRQPEMAVAALTLITGFFLGRLFPSDKESLNSEIITKISSLATQHDNLQDIRNSPYLYSNVSFKELDAGKIALSFDVTTHLDMQAKKNDPLVRDVIAQSLVNPSNVGSELKAISYSEGMADRKVKEALLYSVQAAPVLAVRLKAMDGLVNYQSDPQVEKTFLNVLREDESVKMRLMAIDYLTKHQVSPDSLRLSISESKAPGSPAVMMRVNKYLKQF
jgi:hypothetical protein